MAGLVIAAQLATLAAVLGTIERDVRATMRAELAHGAGRLSQLLGRRSGMLSSGAERLAADLDFRAAIADGDARAIVSALESNVAHIGADLASFVDLDGRLVGSTAAVEGVSDADVYAALVAGLRGEDGALATVTLGGQARKLVAVPVRAPLTLGWLLLGFSLDDTLAGTLREQIDMHVSFVSRTTDRAAPRYHGSTLGTTRRAALPAALRRLEGGEGDPDAVTTVTLAGESFLTRRIPIGDRRNAVTAVLQLSLDEALAGYRRLRARLVAITLASAALAIVLAARFARGVTRPLEALSAAARRARDGDYETPPDVDRDDELGELGETFARMQRGIAEREATIAHRALYDELTQLPNRRLAEDRLQKDIARSRRSGSPLAVAMIGIGRYRQVVETLGHPIGDRLLMQLCARLTARVRGSDTVARVAEDEFLLILNDNDASGAEHCLELLLARLAAPVGFDAAEIAPEPVAGVVLVPEHADEAATALHRASIALADAREAGLGQLFYADGGDERHLRRLALVADIRRAVEHDELTLHFQPKITLADGVAHSAEALLRWTHPEHGFMPPNEFIDIAERSGNVSLLTGWVLREAIAQVARWRAEGIDLAVAVNLSALDLQDDALPARVAALLAEHDVAPSRLILEVTESAMLRDTEQALTLLGALRASGVTLSIDDFGTGYSSLAKLRDLPIDELKIDRAFVIDLDGEEDDGGDALIVRTIITLGHGLGLSITVEGVETEAQCARLARLGCDTVQGYLYSRPLAAEAFVEWYRERHAPPSAA